MQAPFTELFCQERTQHCGTTMETPPSETDKGDKYIEKIERFTKQSPNQDIELTNERVNASSQTLQLGFDHSPKQILNTKRGAGSGETDSPKDKL